MALIWADGFNTYNASGSYVPYSHDLLKTKYGNDSSFRGDKAYWHTSGRYEPGSLSLDDVYTFDYSVTTGTTNDTLITGVAFKPTGANQDATRYSNVFPIIKYSDNLNSSLELCISLFTFFLRDGDEDTLAVIPATFYRDDWNYVEMKATAHSSNGSVEVRLNGCPAFKLDGVKTDFASNGYYPTVWFGEELRPRGNDGLALDDYYICDGSGNRNNDFLGPSTTVATLFPDGDDSTNFATTGNANHATHYEHVDGNNPLGDTDYIQDDTTGNRDIFTMDDTPNYTEIYGLMSCSLSEGITSNTDYSQVLISGNTENQSSNFTAEDGEKITHKTIWEEDPNTSNQWTLSSVNSIKYGVEVK